MRVLQIEIGYNEWTITVLDSHVTPILRVLPPDLYAEQHRVIMLGIDLRKKGDRHDSL